MAKKQASLKKRKQASFIIDSMGGTTAVARLFRISLPSVTIWRKMGIPPARMMYFQLARPDLFVAEKPNKRLSHG